MRQRNIGYQTHEIDVKQILERIRTGGESERHMVMSACYVTYPALADDLYMSIVYGLSYERIEAMKREPVPLWKNDFYGYRRKALSIYYDMSTKEA